MYSTGLQKRRSGRHSNRKKYIDDGPDILALSDDDLLMPIKLPTTPVKSSEPATPSAAENETPVPSTTPGSAGTPNPSCAATPLNPDENSSQSTNNKPNFVFVVSNQF